MRETESEQLRPSPPQTSGSIATAQGSHPVEQLSHLIGNRATIAALKLAPAREPVLQRDNDWWKFWRWGRKRHAAHAAPAIAAPPLVPVMPPPATYAQYGTTTIKVKDDPRYPGPGTFVQVVTQHLDDIRAVIGNGFFDQISATNKSQPIFYNYDENYCRSSPAGWVQLRQKQGQQDNAAFAATLRNTMTAMPITVGELVGALRATDLPRWSGAADPAPISGFREAGETRRKVEAWRGGEELPDNDELDVLLLIVETAAEPGIPNSSSIGYDPNKLSVSTGPRPPQIALFHELVHAYYNAIGRQLGAEESTNEDAGGRLFELMAVGMGPFATRTFSENYLRDNWNPKVPLRTRYGGAK